MTDEQASVIAAAIAFRDKTSDDVLANMLSEDVADSVATIARSLYMDLREMTDRREQLDLVERLASLSSKLEEVR